jgi:hypothetical protein
MERAKTKASAFEALQAAILRAGLTCHALPDGMSVRAAVGLAALNPIYMYSAAA